MAQIVFTPGNIFEVRSATSGPQNVARKALYYNNERANLAGIFAPTARLDGTNGEGGFLDYQFTYIMDRHFNARNNFFRHYLTNYYLYDQNNPDNRTPTGEDPRKRYSPFLWLPNQEKWDLTKYNDDYFKRLRAMLAAAREGIIYVQIVLFDCAGMRFFSRWPLNPWNADRNINGVVDQAPNAGVPSFYKRDLPAKDSNGQTTTTLGAIQDAFIKKTLETSLEFGNVMFEIMNEPTGGTPPLRARWADAIVGTINNATKGRRLIFYNDHTYDLAPEGGVDVNKWKELLLPNYGALDGVIFHGKPHDETGGNNEINPDTRRTWSFRGEKVIQVSSDTVDDVLREKRNWNTNATNKSFQRLMLFQSEATGNEALAGVGASTPKPSFITPFRALGVWDKTSTAGPHFNVRFDANGRFTGFDATTDQIIVQGRLTEFNPDYFTTITDGQTASKQYLYSVSAQRLSYRLTSDGAVLQEFDRFPVDFEPFVFGWEKIKEEPETERPHYFLYFKRKGGALSFSKRAQPGASPFDEGTVTAFSSYPPRITLQSATTGVNVFRYSITNNGKNLTLIGNNRREDFKRVI